MKAAIARREFRRTRRRRGGHRARPRVEFFDGQHVPQPDAAVLGVEQAEAAGDAARRARFGGILRDEQIVANAVGAERRRYHTRRIRRVSGRDRGAIELELERVKRRGGERQQPVPVDVADLVACVGDGLRDRLQCGIGRADRADRDGRLVNAPSAWVDVPGEAAPSARK